MGIGQCNPQQLNWPFAGYTRLRLGVHAGVLTWD
jgi:hypothetical protein